MMKFSLKGLKRENRPKETFLEFISSLLSCWLITIGTCIILDNFFYMQIGVKPIIFQTLFTMVFVALITRRWWIPLIVVGTFTSLIIFGALTNDIFAYLLRGLGDFFKWWFSMLPYESYWHSIIGFTLVHTFINIGVTILFFAITRITKSPWVVVIISLGVLVCTYVTGFINYNLLAIPFLVVGIFPFVASTKFRNKSLPNFKTLFGMMGEKWLYAVVSTFVALVICLTSVIVVFNTDESVRTRFFTDAVSDIQSVTKVYTKEQKNMQVSLYDMGMAVEPEYIGGEMLNFGSAVLAVTDLTEPALVKIAAFDNFDGKKWTNSSDNSYRVDGPWSKQEGKYLSTTLLDDSYYKKFVGKIAKVKRVNVCMNFDSHILPIIGQASNFKETTPNKNQILFDSCGRLFSYYGQQSGFTYGFDTVIYDSKQQLLKQQLREIISIYGSLTDPLYDSEGDFFKQFTQKYENTPKEVEEIIASFRFVKDNYYDKAYRICEYFSKENGFVYTNTPPEFSEDDDIVQKLLETKQGHCVYYSTAMIALAREAGIPSRLAAGYRTVKSSVTNTQVVDRAHPYTWVECYIPHIGWVEFDPTPQKQAVPAPETDSEGNSVSIDIDPDADDDEHRPPGTALEWDGGPNIPLLITMPILAIIVVLLVLNTIFSQHFYKLKSVRKRFKDTKTQVRYYYRDMLLQFMWLGFGLRRGETITELTNRAQGILNEENAKILSDAVSIIEAMYYGNETPTDEQVEVVFGAREILENELKGENNKVLYILKRRLLLPIFNWGKKAKAKKSKGDF